jgi:hypothetical protein
MYTGQKKVEREMYVPENGETCNRLVTLLLFDMILKYDTLFSSTKPYFPCNIQYIMMYVNYFASCIIGKHIR